MHTDGTFAVRRDQLYDAFIRGIRHGGEPLPPLVTDPDAFTPHGSEYALDRWADDGGRVP